VAIVHTIGLIIAVGTLIASVILYRGASSLERSIENELNDADE